MLSRRVLNRTLVYQINREEAPPGNNQKGLLEGKPTVQLNRTLGFPENPLCRLLSLKVWVCALFLEGALQRLWLEELIFGKGRRTATFQFSESGGSVNGPNLFTELPFL